MNQTEVEHFACVKIYDVKRQALKNIFGTYVTAPLELKNVSQLRDGTTVVSTYVYWKVRLYFGFQIQCDAFGLKHIDSQLMFRST